MAALRWAQTWCPPPKEHFFCINIDRTTATSMPMKIFAFGGGGGGMFSSQLVSLGQFFILSFCELLFFGGYFLTFFILSFCELLFFRLFLKKTFSCQLVSLGQFFILTFCEFDHFLLSFRFFCYCSCTLQADYSTTAGQRKTAFQFQCFFQHRVTATHIALPF